MASHGIARTNRNRTEEQRQQDLDRIKKYRDLDDQIQVHVKQSNYDDPALFHLTTKILRLNPEYYTIWNVRVAEYFSERHYETVLRRLLAFALGCDPARPSDVPVTQEDWRECPSSPSPSPLLIEFPKCYWIWGYRSFLLSLCDRILPAAVARDFWVAELALDSKMLTKDRRNFHAWTYRRFIVAALESTAAAETTRSMTESEFEYTYSMIKVDLSNFSAWHNRSKLALRLLDERGADDAARKKFLDQELELAREGLNVGPEDQSLWYYHQFLMDQITTLSVSKEDADAKGLIALNLSLADRKEFIDREVAEIKDLLEDYEDVKLIYEALLEYAMAYRAMSASDGETANQDEMMAWLAKLRELDPLRQGRWDDLEKSLKAA
ncbi:geranylgeranyl transferase type-2 subunit beta [Apiospora arundinis]